VFFFVFFFSTRRVSVRLYAVNTPDSLKETPMKRIASLAAVIALLLLGVTAAQEREDRTLLNWDQMRAIINETSGERAMHHVLELVPYPRVRPRSEYEVNFRESMVMAQFAREYGYSSVEIESFPSPQRLWQPTQGELWMVEPELRKISDIYDVAVALAANSETGDVTAELVDVGTGARAEDYGSQDLKGKMVLGSAPAGSLQRLGVFERGAAGVLSYNSLRPDSYPDQISSQSVTAVPAGGTDNRKTGFGWSMAPRVARELSAILSRGQKVVLRSIVKAETFPGEMEVVHATINGDGSSNQDIVVSGHLYEGYIKQGANDDNSGCAMTLEMGRVYIRLVKEGKLPPPKRTIHFLWVPEISGTNAWLNKHEDLKKRMIADLNFDMEGLRLSASGSSWVLHRTPDTFPTYLNDLGQNVLEFVANLNRERVRYRGNGYRFTLPVTAPNGSQDPFWYVIDKHYGSSDHVTYMQHGIGSLMFITWPDMWYHSSQDTPDKLDPTQFKRAAVVGTGAMSVLASAADEMGAKIAGESLARGAERVGDSQRKGLAYLADSNDGAALAIAYKEALNAIRHQTEIEKAVLKSAAILFASPADGEKKLAPFDPLLQQRADALKNEVSAFYRLRAEQLKVMPAEPVMTQAEKAAAGLNPERVGGQGRGPGGGGGRASGPSKVPQHMTAELNILLGKRKSVLEIRDFLSGEFEPLPLTDLMEYFKAQEQAGSMKLTPKP
jgi:aminopeptidase YwaD